MPNRTLSNLKQTGTLQVIVGAGATGSAVARLLAESDEEVRLVSRRGTGPKHPNIKRIAADARNTKRLLDLTKGAATLFNCAMPAYDRWVEEFPPLAGSLLSTAEQTGANYVMLGNAYGYGKINGPVHEDLPMAPTTVKGQIRARIWLNALSAYRAGRVRVAEVRASDFLGAGAASLYNLMVTPKILDDKPASYPGNLLVPHSWTYIGDVAKILVTISRDEYAWGKAWHVPSTSTASVLELSGKLARVAGLSNPHLTQMTIEELDHIAKSYPVMAEIKEMLYLDLQPFILDSSKTKQAFDLRPTPLEKVLTETIQYFNSSETD